MAALIPLGVQAAQLKVPSSYNTIQAAVDAASPGDEILVSGKFFGSYNENILITTNDLTIRSTGLLPVFVIGQSGGTSLGTFVLSNVSGVTLQGMTILGLDNGYPGIENAAVYIQKNANDITITRNTITAVGDAAIVSEYGYPISGISVTHNIIGGKTFEGNEPAGTGFGNQFTTPNVPRQGVVLGSPGASNITFANNVVSVQAGGINASNEEQGNGIVTIHADGSTVSNNIFSSNSNRYASQLRVRGSNSIIENNGFVSLLMGEQTSQIFLDTTDRDLTAVYYANSFDNAAFADNEGKTIYKRLKPALAVSADDATVTFTGRELDGVVIEHSIDLIGDGGTILGNLQGNEVAISVEASDVSIESVNITAISSPAGTGVKLASGVSNVTVANSTILASKYGITNSLPGGNNDITIFANSFIFTGSDNGNPVYLNGPASNGDANEGIFISGNYFSGDVNSGVVVGIEGSEIQISGNDFADASSDFSIIEIWNGDAAIDGNCFAASSGAIIKASGGASVVAEYNYFGSEAGPVEGNADGIDTTPFLLGCDAFYVEAEQTAGGTISPAYAYTNASAPAVFTITPSSLSVLNDVLINSVSVGAVGTYDASAVSQDSVITALFTQNGASVTVLPTVNGTVSPSGQINVAAGDSHSFVLTPNTGYSIGTVTYNNNDITSQVSPAGLLNIFNIVGQNTLEVTYVLDDPFTVTAIKSGTYANYGNVTVTGSVPPTATAEVNVGGSVEYTITCPAPFAVRQVKINGAVVSTNKITNGGVYTVTNVSVNTVVEFSFGLNN